MMHIRKPIDKLTPTDLEQFLFWEFVLDEEGFPGQDETTVRPVLATDPADWTGSSIVSATFVLADGRHFTGHCSPVVDDAGQLTLKYPVIVTESGHVGFYHGILKPSAEQIRQDYGRLGKQEKDVFPITFRLAVDYLAPLKSGMIEGFSYLATLEGPIEIVK